MQARMATIACSYQIQLHMGLHLHLANITVPASHDKSSLCHSFGWFSPGRAQCQIVPLTRSRTEFQPNRTSTQTTTTFINEMNTAALPRSFARFESS